MKRMISVLVIACMAFTCAAIIPDGQSHAASKKDGFYTFYPDGYDSVTVKITKKTITVIDNDETCWMRYKKRFHSGRMYDNEKYMNGNQKFKLAKKIYVFDTESPTHKVKKYGAKFNVTHAKKISRSKLYKQRKKYRDHVVLYLIVKKGKVVAIGDSAGEIDKY